MSAFNVTKLLDYCFQFSNFYGLLTYQVPKGGRLEDWQEHDEPSIHHRQAQVDVSLARQDQVKKAIIYILYIIYLSTCTARSAEVETPRTWLKCQSAVSG